MLEEGTVLIKVESTLQTTQCHRCGREIDRFHGFDRPIRLRHLPVFGRPVVVEIRPKRYRYPYCEGGPTTTQRCVGYDPNRLQTTAFEEDVLKRLIHGTVADASRQLGLGIKAVERYLGRSSGTDGGLDRVCYIGDLDEQQHDTKRKNDFKHRQQTAFKERKRTKLDSGRCRGRTRTRRQPSVGSACIPKRLLLKSHLLETTMSNLNGVYPEPAKNGVRYSNAILLATIVSAMLHAQSAFSAPAITSVSGSASHGQSITIIGTGFGIKNPAEPVLWAPFDTSIDPSPLGRIKAWDQSDQYPRCVQYVSTGGRSGGGVRTLDTCARTNTAELFIRTGSLGYYFNTLGQKNYLFRQRRMGYTNDVNLKSIEFMEFNNYTNGNNIVFNHTTRQWISQNIPNDSYCYMNNSPAENQWATEEMVQQTSQTANADGMIRWYANGVLIGESPSCEIAFRANPGTNMDTIKPIFHGDYNISAGSMSTTPEWWDSVYIDNTWSRVMLGSASTFSASTQREIQIPTIWTSDSITISVNSGAFGTGQTVYLYVIDSDGAVNSNGYPISIGQSSDSVLSVPQQLRIISF